MIPNRPTGKFRRMGRNQLRHSASVS
jgi:hypothetical protein